MFQDTQMGTFNFMSPEVIEDLSGGPMDDGEDFEVSCPEFELALLV